MNTYSSQKRKSRKNSMDWGEDPGIYGPRDYFRNFLLLKEFKRYASGKTLLDYGCGVGNMFVYFLRKGYTITGVDISKAATLYVRKGIAKLPFHRQAHIYCGTFETVSLRSGSFDAIWCSEVLEHIPHDAPVVKNFYRILKPGGKCFISVPKGMNHWNDLDVYAGHYRRYTEEQLVRLFRQNGFHIERIVVWGFPFTRLWDYLIYGPLLRAKMKHKIIYHDSSRVLSRLMRNRLLVQLVSFIFLFDELWNWTKLGKGIILVARKKGKNL